jgi:hypothetical protein
VKTNLFIGRIPEKDQFCPLKPKDRGKPFTTVKNMAVLKQDSRVIDVSAKGHYIRFFTLDD